MTHIPDPFPVMLNSSCPLQLMNTPAGMNSSHYPAYGNPPYGNFYGNIPMFPNSVGIAARQMPWSETVTTTSKENCEEAIPSTEQQEETKRSPRANFETLADLASHQK